MYAVCVSLLLSAFGRIDYSKAKPKFAKYLFQYFALVGIGFDSHRLRSDLPSSSARFDSCEPFPLLFGHPFAGRVEKTRAERHTPTNTEEKKKPKQKRFKIYKSQYNEKCIRHHNGSLTNMIQTRCKANNGQRAHYVRLKRRYQFDRSGNETIYFGEKLKHAPQK